MVLILTLKWPWHSHRQVCLYLSAFHFPFLSFPFLFRDKNSGQSLSQLIEFQFFSSPASSAAASSGMHFSQAVAIIQSQVGVIKGVQVLYSDTVSQRLLWALANTYFGSNRPLSGSIGRGYSNKFTPGRNPTDLWPDRATLEGHRGIQYETR